MRPIAASIAGAFAITTLLSTASAAPLDVPLRLVVDGRALDAHRAHAVLRDGVAYVDVVSGVRAVGGFLRFGKRGAIRISAGGRSLDLALGRRTATLDSGSVALAGAPFAFRGDDFVPLTTLAMLAGAKVTLDSHGRRASLALGHGERFAPAVVRAPDGEDIAPSPTQALSFATTGTTDARGLHARVDVTNGTAKPYTLAFPTARQLSFVIARNGSEIWRSADAIVGTEPSTLTIPAHGTIAVTSDYENFAALGPGRYMMRVRIMTQVPIDLTPIPLDP